MPSSLLSWSTVLFLAVCPSAHADPARGTLLKVVAPTRALRINEGQVEPVQLVGRLLSDNTSAWACEWSLDGSRIAAGTFDQDGYCATKTDVSRLAAGPHGFQIAAIHRLTDFHMYQVVYMTTNGRPEVTATAVASCVDVGEELAIKVDVSDMSYVTHAVSEPAAKEYVDLSVDLVDNTGAPVGSVPGHVTLDENGVGSTTLTLPVPSGAAENDAYTWYVTATDPEGAEGSPVEPGHLYIEPSDPATYYDGAAYALGGSPDLAAPIASTVWSIESTGPYVSYPVFVTIPGSAADDVTFGYDGPDGNDEDIGDECVTAGGDTWVCPFPSGGLVEGTYTVFATTHGECITADTVDIELVADETLVDNDRDGLSEQGDPDQIDCDDQDPDVYQGDGLADQCSSVDDDCDGVLNEDAMDANEGTTGNEDILSATETGVATTDGDGDFVIAEGNLHEAGDVDWLAFGVGEPDRGNHLAFSVFLDVPGDCTAAADWGFSLWASTDERDSTTVDASGALLINDADITEMPCDDSGVTAVREWYVEPTDGADRAFWWAEVSASTWSEPYCGDSGADTYTLTVED